MFGISGEHTYIRPFLTRKCFHELFGLEGSKKFLEKNRQVHNLKISDRVSYDPRVFSEKYSWFHMQRISYLVVREEGMGWGGKTLMEE